MIGGRDGGNLPVAVSSSRARMWTVPVSASHSLPVKRYRFPMADALSTCPDAERIVGCPKGSYLYRSTTCPEPFVACVIDPTACPWK